MRLRCLCDVAKRRSDSRQITRIHQRYEAITANRQRKQAACTRDVDSCFELVASENPGLDAGLDESAERCRDTFLESVLNGRDAEKNELLLDAISGCLQSAGSIVHRDLDTRYS